ncbi:hypothetical protein [Streptomyces coeruleorubidus]|uniref:DUF2946 domain-containing protein n=1 Tax=Streptomyces coeruleorubidus TaxID=116188 RepID=A0ABZ0KMJ6_STRC4|nr:hypothetical protein [Streptomyces coeruleorubidus]WOT39051.1 hypothetical protein R5U08_35020 [Streptomyces coeruleorubidus]
MTAPGAWAPRTRASHGVVRRARAALIALLAALAVLIHHETAAAAISSNLSSAAHMMTPGMVMSGNHAAPATGMSGHGHGSAAELTTAAVPTKSIADSPPCSGMTMQHCATASFEVVKLAPPTQTPVPWGLTVPVGVATGPKAAGAVNRAPPDLSVLSQLRI